MPSLVSATSFICGLSVIVLAPSCYLNEYLNEDHCGDLLGRKLLGLTEVLNLNKRVAALVDDLEWPRLDILLDGLVLESATDQSPKKISIRTSRLISCMMSSLDIKDGVFWVHSSLVLGRLADETLLACEGHKRGCGKATLLVGDYGQDC